jgi:hypothetical protein
MAKCTAAAGCHTIVQQQQATGCLTVVQQQQAIGCLTIVQQQQATGCLTVVQQQQATGCHTIPFLWVVVFVTLSKAGIAKTRCCNINHTIVQQQQPPPCCAVGDWCCALCGELHSTERNSRHL